MDATPALLRPGSMYRLAGETASKVWVNAVWARSVKGGKVAVAFGSVWTVVDIDRDDPLTLAAFTDAFEARRLAVGHDALATFDGTNLTMRGHGKQANGREPSAHRRANPRRVAAILPRLVQVHATITGKKMPAVPDGWKGWYALTPGG
ncbi:hypothetical protein CHO01_17260 [Cellulomonas hominis]|nr:hypothetical protein CHO01_17260 [Cellulomonas hominis]